MTQVLGEVAAQDAAPWVPTDKTFGARLALVRWKMGWNIKEAALECGVPAASWRSWEMSGSLPRRYIEICALVADKAGCDRDWLVDGRKELSRVSTCYGNNGEEAGPTGWIPVPPVGRRPPNYPTGFAHPPGQRRAVVLKQPS